MKILFLSVNPPTLNKPLSLEEETRAIDQVLRRSETGRNFEIEHGRAVRVSDLQELLLRHSPQIVHFSGHGTGENGLIFQDDQGNPQLVSTAALTKLFSNFRNIRCVVLNACFSVEQARDIGEHIDYVVGMNTKIYDKASISFASEFYQALGYRKDFKSAFELGKTRLNLEGLQDATAPELFVNPCLESTYVNAPLNNFELSISQTLKCISKERLGIVSDEHQLNPARSITDENFKLSFVRALLSSTAAQMIKVLVDLTKDINDYEVVSDILEILMLYWIDSNAVAQIKETTRFEVAKRTISINAVWPKTAKLFFRRASGDSETWSSIEILSNYDTDPYTYICAQITEEARRALNIEDDFDLKEEIEASVEDDEFPLVIIVPPIEIDSMIGKTYKQIWEIWLKVIEEYPSITFIFLIGNQPENREIAEIAIERVKPLKPELEPNAEKAYWDRHHRAERKVKGILEKKSVF